MPTDSKTISTTNPTDHLKGLYLQCTVCQRTYAPGEVEYTCVDCGEVGTLDILYDYAHLRTLLNRDAMQHNREGSMWRYRNIMPLRSDSSVPPLRVGNTPLYETPRLAAELGLKQAWVKDDGQNPTASLKDRASAMVVAHAMEVGIDTVTTASTGNAAAALAGIGASVGIRTIIFVPASAPVAKIAQLLVFGAEVLLIEDTYDTAFDLCMTISQEQGWYCRNTGINPYTTEGKKTAAFEMAEGLGWNMPDAVVVSVGDGSIIGGTYKGFYDLYKLGWISRIPRLIGVQSEGSAPLVHAWESGLPADEMQPIDAHSVADSIVAGLPRDRVKALRAITETNGAYISVSDDAILESIPRFARATGVFAEPAAVSVLAGAEVALAKGHLKPDERVVFLSTGNGLKDVVRAQQSVPSGTRVAPSMEAVRQALKL